jgi:hypothetical protein
MALRKYALLLAVAAAPLLLAATGCRDEPEPEAGQVVQVVDQPQAAPEPAPAREPARAERPKPQRTPGNSVLYGPTDYLRTTTITVPRRIKTQANLAYVTNEIKQFWALKNRYPSSLKELEEWRGSALYKLPAGYKYDYDAATGALDVVADQ